MLCQFSTRLEFQTSTEVKANFNVTFYIYSDILVAETMQNSRLLQQSIRYDTTRYIYVSLKADEMASFI